MADRQESEKSLSEEDFSYFGGMIRDLRRIGERGREFSSKTQETIETLLDTVHEASDEEERQCVLAKLQHELDRDVKGKEIQGIHYRGAAMFVKAAVKVLGNRYRQY
jgi:hypothetical protein